MRKIKFDDIPIYFVIHLEQNSCELIVFFFSFKAMSNVWTNKWLGILTI